jgi:mono/diheme cytochrome c family protein
MIGLASTAIAWIIFTVVIVGWLAYAFLNTASARKEVGSEVELAANRKPYYDDETLEGPRLERLQLIGVLLLVVNVIGLPLYWILEPSRQAGATEGLENRLVSWGADLFAPTGETAVALNCAGCHGGMQATGGPAAYTVTDPNTREVTSVNWRAPALNTVLYRFSEDEVRFILTYGRPGTPMSAWGLDGGGPLNAQQIESLIAYIRSIQIPREDCLPEEADDPNCPSGHLPADMQADIDNAARQAVEDGEYDSYGEALFNLELSNGAYSCARCHTQGWSYDDPQRPGQGNFGWNLTGGSESAHFPNRSDMETFIAEGSDYGARYGTAQAQGSGRMPGFGSLLTDEQIAAIVDYERGL